MFRTPRRMTAATVLFLPAAFLAGMPVGSEAHQPQGLVRSTAKTGRAARKQAVTALSKAVKRFDDLVIVKESAALGVGPTQVVSAAGLRGFETVTAAQVNQGVDIGFVFVFGGETGGIPAGFYKLHVVGSEGIARLEDDEGETIATVSIEVAAPDPVYHSPGAVEVLVYGDNTDVSFETADTDLTIGLERLQS